MSLLVPFLFVCLFVRLRYIYYCYFVPSRPPQGKHSTFISFHADNITCIEWEYTFSRELVNVNANTNQQTKTKEHNMDPSLSQSHYTFTVCPLLWLELPLGHIMIASQFSLKGLQKLSALGWKTTFLTQKKEVFSGILNLFFFPFLIKKNTSKKLQNGNSPQCKIDFGYRYRTLCLTCAASSKNRRGVSRYPPSQATTLPFMAK